MHIFEAWNVHLLSGVFLFVLLTHHTARAYWVVWAEDDRTGRASLVGPLVFFSPRCGVWPQKRTEPTSLARCVA
jgi:hypothetical protein